MVVALIELIKDWHIRLEIAIFRPIFFHSPLRYLVILLLFYSHISIESSKFVEKCCLYLLISIQIIYTENDHIKCRMIFMF